MGKKSKKGQSRSGNSGKRKKSNNNKKKNSKKIEPKSVEDVAAAAATVEDTTTTPKDITQELNNAQEETVEEKVASEPEPTAVVEPEEETKESSIPEGLESSMNLFTESQQTLALALCSANQGHLFDVWASEPSSDEIQQKKKDLMAQLERMDQNYPSGGLTGYISNAKELLEKSRQGLNPLEGWTPSVPVGERFTLGTGEYTKFEKKGLGEVGKCGFVLVAGGLGERLGYSDIKLGLPTELATETCYLQLYIETILAIQAKYSSDIKLPLCIMVSNDTNSGTVKLLEENNYFGMDKDQVTLVQQGDGVPALIDNNATIAMKSDPYSIQAKPHGHGDIHALLHSHGVAKSWCEMGLEWMIFCQDTNGLAFHTLPLALGVSKDMGLIMNSIAVPRKAKQAIGGITKLTSDGGDERTINVEYNQLDPLLRASGSPDGDVNDDSGYSPFPGNINQLLFNLNEYTKVLERTKGAMPEFVNPKYADADKTVFKKPTRLECMMQDFPTTLIGSVSKKVGFTSIPADLCFSPVKNATKDGVALQQKGTSPGVAASGEADQYAAIRNIMKSIGCAVEDASPATFSGITVVPGPEVVLKPSFVTCPAEYLDKFPKPSQVKISSKSSLVINGSGVVIESLDLDGALEIECEEGASGVLRDVVVKNEGWKKVADEDSEKEYIRIRGYHLEKVETKKITIKKDGTIDGYTPPAQNPAPVVESKSRTLPVAPVEAETEVKSPRATDLTKPAAKESTDVAEKACCIIS